MDALIEGYRRYRAERWPELRELHRSLARGQRPRAMVIACSDSRVDPATIFDARPGELFVVRNIANLAPPFETGGGHHGVSAAIEFAVETLEVETILVLGHADCGGVRAALARGHAHVGSFLDDWVSLMEPAKARVAGAAGAAGASGATDDAERALQYESVRVSLENLMTFPFVAARVRDGRLTLAGAHYGVGEGRLELLDAGTDRFTPLD